MKFKKNILVLEAGGPCGVACIKLIRNIGNIYTIGADMDPYAAGFGLSDKALIVPPFGQKNFSRIIKNIIKMYKIDLILPSFEHGFDKLKNIDGPFVNDFQSAIKCKDKLLFYSECMKTGLPVPETTILSKPTDNNIFPKYIKPRFGVGSRDNFIVYNNKQLEGLSLYLLNKGEDYIVQDYLEGQHWNVDVLVQNSKIKQIITRRDIKQKSGNCITVEIVNKPTLKEFAKKVQKILSINSVFNLEVFETKPNVYIINEVNVRFGGGIIFGALAGCDMVAYLVTGNQKYIKEPREGIYTRYYQEIICPKVLPL